MSSIRQRLTRRLLFTLAALISVGALAAYLCASAALQRQFDSALRARAETLTGLLEQNGANLEWEATENSLRDYADGSGRAYFEIWRANGEVFERSASLGETSLARPAAPLATPQFYDVELPGDLDARALALQFTPRAADPASQSVRAPVTLVVALNREGLDHTLATLQLVLGGTGLALLAATALLVPWALRRELRPLDAFAGQAQVMDANTLHERFATAQLPAELTPVAMRLNELLGRLEAAFERERRFSADVAHEFRTPLAELHVLAELSLKLPDTRTAETDRDVLAIARHLESMTGRLLALARGERGELPVHRESIELRPFVASICDSQQTRATTRQLSFAQTIPADTRLTTDPALLRSILTNLVDNAIAYSRPGTAIEISAQPTASSCTLTIASVPADLAPADLPHLFERFWRKDSARVTDGHAGLGLSLARTFARALGGDLTARWEAAERIVFSLRL